MTRPRAASERFVAQLPSDLLGRVTPIYSPLLDIRPGGEEIDLSGVRGLIFTSSNGVSAATTRLADRALPAFCVGQATTLAARKAGWGAQTAGETAEELIATLLRSHPDGPLLHLRGEHVRGDIARRLTQSGLSARDHAIYQQHLLSFSDEAQAAMSETCPVIAPLFSPRTARQFADLWDGSAPLWLIAMSEAVAKPLETLPFRRLGLAKRPDAGAMARATEKLVKHAMRVEGDGDAD